MYLWLLNKCCDKWNLKKINGIQHAKTLTGKGFQNHMNMLLAI